MPDDMKRKLLRQIPLMIIAAMLPVLNVGTSGQETAAPAAGDPCGSGQNGEAASAASFLPPQAIDTTATPRIVL
jgi:hypothetical protein